MDEPIVEEHAFKHGLTEEQILQAWGNFLAKHYRGAPDDGQILAIGCDARGNLIQMVAVERPFGILIFHAMTPPTASALSELGLARRQR